MPVSVFHSRLIFDALKACDISIISALPETWLVHLIRMVEDDPAMTLVRVWPGKRKALASPLEHIWPG